ncbi:MAG: tRNA pseudouridine(13) synthase TruD [Halobacteria archaeon]
MTGPPAASELGLDWYASTGQGTGGSLKNRPEDFVVREVEDFNYDDEGRHVVARISLRNYETHRFARDLSNQLGISRKRVNWAGTKDKRAVTTQVFTVDTDPEKLEEVGMGGVDIDVLGRSHHPISLGDLMDNKFEVTVRGVENPAAVEPVDSDLEEFGGVPNLFGGQRFGSRRPVTHRVGRQVLEEDYRSAVLSYLVDSFETEPKDTRRARIRLKNEMDFGDALQYFPERLGYELSLLNELVQGSGYREAFDAFPDNLQRLFVNAEQSRIFNLILRERYESGLKFDRAYPGDVVCFSSDGYPDKSRTQRVKESNVESINRHVDAGRAYVTAPLLGSETELGEGDIGKMEREVIDGVGLSREYFTDVGFADYDGDRRPILIHPNPEHGIEENVAEFRFSLPKGSYATVVLREYTKNR